MILMSLHAKLGLRFRVSLAEVNKPQNTADCSVCLKNPTNRTLFSVLQVPRVFKASKGKSRGRHWYVILIFD